MKQNISFNLFIKAALIQRKNIKELLLLREKAEEKHHTRCKIKTSRGEMSISP